MRTCRADKSCGVGNVKVGRVTPLRVNYGARQTSRLGDHYREIVRIACATTVPPMQPRASAELDFEMRKYESAGGTWLSEGETNDGFTW